MSPILLYVPGTEQCTYRSKLFFYMFFVKTKARVLASELLAFFICVCVLMARELNFEVVYAAGIWKDFMMSSIIPMHNYRTGRSERALILVVA